MRPRRSRFSRVYRQITRRRTTRRQWQQISHLRPQGSLGHPAVAAHAYSQASFGPEMEEPRDWTATEWRADTTSMLDFVAEENSPPRPQSSTGMAAMVAGLAIALFLLACAYAGYSGFMHASNDALAWFGIVGALACLVSVGVGISLWASDLRRHYSGRFLVVAACFLASFFCVLMICR